MSHNKLLSSNDEIGRVISFSIFSTLSNKGVKPPWRHIEVLLTIALNGKYEKALSNAS